MAEAKKEMTTLRPKPTQEEAELIMRLKQDQDFQQFVNKFLRERSVQIAFMACNPFWDPRQCNFMQGRVHEMVDVRNMIDNIENILEDFRKKPGGMV